jgi:hypothetical protein
MSESKLKPIEKGRVLTADQAPKVRWLGSDGGARLGIQVGTHHGGIYAWDQHRSESVLLYEGEYESNRPKDDAGNPR